MAANDEGRCGDALRRGAASSTTAATAAPTWNCIGSSPRYGCQPPAACSSPLPIAESTSTVNVRLITFRERPGRRRPRRATRILAGASSNRPNPVAPCTATTHFAWLGLPTPNARTPLMVATTRSVSSATLSGRVPRSMSVRLKHPADSDFCGVPVFRLPQCDSRRRVKRRRRHPRRSPPSRRGRASRCGGRSVRAPADRVNAAAHR